MEDRHRARSMAAGTRSCFVRVSWTPDPLARAPSPAGQTGCFLGKEVGTVALFSPQHLAHEDQRAGPGPVHTAWPDAGERGQDRALRTVENTHTHTGTCTRMCTHTCRYGRTRMCARTRTHRHVYQHTGMCAHANTRACRLVHTRTCAHTGTCTNTAVCTHTRVHIGICTRAHTGVCTQACTHAGVCTHRHAARREEGGGFQQNGSCPEMVLSGGRLLRTQVDAECRLSQTQVGHYGA